MYKLLLVTDQEDKIALLQHQIDWPSLGCRAPQIVRSAEAGVELLNSSAVDAVGYSLKGDSTPLTRYLRYGRPSLPIFEVAEDFEKQRAILKETVQLLDRLHADFSDDYYDEDAMLTLQRDELVTQLLSGQLRDYAALERELRLIRSRVDAHGVCALYELDMPRARFTFPSITATPSSAWKAPCVIISSAAMWMIFITPFPCRRRGTSACCACPCKWRSLNRPRRSWPGRRPMCRIPFSALRNIWIWICKSSAPIAWTG